MKCNQVPGGLDLHKGMGHWGRIGFACAYGGGGRFRYGHAGGGDIGEGHMGTHVKHTMLT